MKSRCGEEGRAKGAGPAAERQRWDGEQRRWGVGVICIRIVLRFCCESSSSLIPIVVVSVSVIVIIRM